MHDDISTPTPARPGTSLLSALIAAAGTAAMGAALSTLHASARSGHGEEALIAWVLLGLAGLGALLCLHLTLTWTLATLVLVVGPASRTGIALLAPLRILAPRLARRLATGAAVATAATALTLTSGLAAEGPSAPAPAPDTAAVAQTAELSSAEAPPTDPAPEAAAPGAAGEGPGHSGTAPLPSLGWDGSTAPATTGPAPTTSTAAPGSAGSDGSGDSGGSGGSASTRAPETPQRTVVVLPGDSLWSISDELLGPAASDPAEIAVVWPILHDANRDLIGEDPDLLRPGQELTVPTALTTSQDRP
jgi:resuscitation-promoting factor RpfA